MKMEVLEAAIVLFLFSYLQYSIVVSAILD